MSTHVLVVSGKAEGTPRGPRRVRLVEPWRVEDIVVPLAGEEEDEMEMKQEDQSVKDESVYMEERIEVAMDRGSKVETREEKEEHDREMMPPPLTPLRGRSKLSEEERQVRFQIEFSVSDMSLSHAYILTILI